jgi:hypothetical protein
MVKRHNGKLKHAPPKHRTPITASPIHKDAPKKRQVAFWEMTVRTKEPIAGANSPLTTSNSLGARQNALIGSRNRNGPRTWIARGRGRLATALF